MPANPLDRRRNWRSAYAGIRRKPANPARAPCDHRRADTGIAQNDIKMYPEFVCLGAVTQPFANRALLVWLSLWGRKSIGERVVAEVLDLIPSENVRLNPDCLSDLYMQLGEAGAEDVVCRAIEEMALRLAQCERFWREEKWQDLRKCARSLIAMAEQVGMTKLARVASDVTQAVDDFDRAAIGATLFRLIRIGERSLLAVWDIEDLSV